MIEFESISTNDSSDVLKNIPLLGWFTLGPPGELKDAKVYQVLGNNSNEVLVDVALYAENDSPEPCQFNRGITVYLVTLKKYKLEFEYEV